FASCMAGRAPNSFKRRVYASFARITRTDQSACDRHKELKKHPAAAMFWPNDINAADRGTKIVHRRGRSLSRQRIGLPSSLASTKRRRMVRGNRGKAVTRPSYRMVTLAGLEPATSPAPGENKDALSPLSYSAVMILMTFCGGVRAAKKPTAPYHC